MSSSRASSNHPIYVIGHRNPDTDSICAAIACAHLKHRLGDPHVVPARAGEINRQTEFVLKRFGMERPLFLPDVRVRVRDVMTPGAKAVRETQTVGEVLAFMETHDLLLAPVVDEQGQYKGVITLQDLAHFYTIRQKETEASSRMVASIQGIARTLEATLLHGKQEEVITPLRVVVGAMREEGFLRVLEGVQEPAVVVVGDRRRIQELAVQRGVRLLIITGGFLPSPEILEVARRQGVSVLSTTLDTATVVRRLHLSTPAREIYSREAFQADPEGLLTEVRHQMTSQGIRGAPVVDRTGQLVGVLTRSDLLKEYRKRLILVDHNEASQAVHGIEEAEVLEVYDHHRLGSFQTLHPIRFMVEPVGSTNTILAEMYQRYQVIPDREVAGLMLSAILSDTVILRSPTTTERDRKAAHWLAERAGEDIHTLGEAIFQASSDLLGRPPEEIIKTDFKVYEVGGHRVGIGQVEVIEMFTFERIREGLQEVLDRMIHTEGFTFTGLLVTDIIYENSVLLFSGDPEIVRRMGYALKDESLADLPGVLSRKKQLMPRLLGALQP